MSVPAPAAFIADLFAPHTIAARTATADSSDIAALHVAEAEHIEPMAGGRRAEYATGRACARAALGSLAAAKSSASNAVAIRRDHKRAPIWPEGVTGSISHTEGLCAAVAARTSPDLAAIGLDIERIDRVSKRVRRLILTEHENAELAAMTSDQAQRAAAAAFAAKEAFYKAQYQLTSTYLGFRAVEVTATDDELSFRSSHRTVLPLLDRLNGRFTVRDGRIIAAVFIGQPSTPAKAT